MKERFILAEFFMYVNVDVYFIYICLCVNIYMRISKTYEQECTSLRV